MVRFFDPEMDRRLLERYWLQHDLRSAIAHNEFTLDYQPQAKMDGKVFGFEALLRWHHPKHGLVPPASFITLAEQNGMIGEIGEWTLREACREAASWPSPLQIGVNLSPIQFRHGDLPGLVHQILLDTGLAPVRLELEITEGVLISDPSRALSILRRLKILGVKIAMDDFGTGYASLSSLQSFPFDKIKIDRTFISGVDSNAQSAAIVRAIIGLGTVLRIPVIAEGVETEAERKVLMRKGCEEIQGYLVGHPCPIATYSALTEGIAATVPVKALAG
jgi:EAL domain-containing protein (putative c-di-GMP-specific phosphodiesterase class I)